MRGTIARMTTFAGLALAALLAAGCGEDPVATTPAGGQIIADHTVVARCAAIPQVYIDKVKAMWLNIPGESHSEAYRAGLELLAAVDPRFAVLRNESGDPPAPVTNALRVDKALRLAGGGMDRWPGESTWFANGDRTPIKNHIGWYHTNSYNLAAIGFGWCWDLTRNGLTVNPDPVYGVRWAGSTEGGPQGDKAWGLDAADYAQTTNTVCMDTYLQATEEYRLYALAIGAPTKAIFTTGPVDAGDGSYAGENGYQGHLKHEYIRAFVKAHPDRILFDYADILTHDDDGTPNTTTWTTHQYPLITTANLGDGSFAHISEAGELRIGKALWWMLARIAGWDGN